MANSNRSKQFSRRSVLGGFIKGSAALSAPTLLLARAGPASAQSTTPDYFQPPNLLEAMIEGVTGELPPATFDPVGFTKTLTIESAHTGERLTADYVSGGRISRKVMREFTHLMRDHRDGTEKDIDPYLLDLLHTVILNTGNYPDRVTIRMNSGYRSPRTNAWLARNSYNVSQDSQHMRGKAIDFSIPGISLSDIREQALKLRQGGVGYYPGDRFVHLDTGRVRSWRA